MKIKDIYSKKGNCTISVILAFLCVAVTSVSMLFPETYQNIAYAYPLKYPWQICSGIFLHGSPELPIIGSIGHLIFNLLLVIPFGIMVEKVIGTKKICPNVPRFMDNKCNFFFWYCNSHNTCWRNSLWRRHFWHCLFLRNRGIVFVVRFRLNLPYKRQPRIARSTRQIYLFRMMVGVSLKPCEKATT